MKKMMVCLVGLAAVSAFGKEYPMRCMENPEEWSSQYSNPEKTVDKKARRNLVQLTPKIEALWKELQAIMSSEAFQAEGMSSEAFQAWAVKHQKLTEEVQKKLMDFSYTNTDYAVCEQAVQYGLAFQKEYARAMAAHGVPTHPAVQEEEADLMKYLNYLPK